MNTFLKTFISVILFTSVHYPQTITSKSTGGNWEDAATWIGGVVPNESNNVIIDGTVSITTFTSKCKDLTINSGKILQNGGGYGWVIPQVKGNIINNGTIRNNPSGNSLCLEVLGNITNNGTWTLSVIYLPGNNKQYLSQASGKSFESEFYKRNSSGWCDTNLIIALTPLTFTKTFELSGTLPDGRGYWGALDMSGNSLTMTGSAAICYGTIKNAANVYVYEQAVLRNVTYTGAVILHGSASILNSEVIFEGDVTVADTLQNTGSYGWITPVFKGKFTNNGVIRNNPKGNELWLELQGDVVNNGKWINTKTFLPGKKIQYISQSQGKTFECDFYKRNAQGWCDTNKLAASSALTFAKVFELSGTLPDLSGYWGTLDMAGNTLNMTGEANINYGTIANATNINVSPGAVIGSITYKGPVTIHGTASVINSSAIFEGDVTVADTLQNGGGYGWLTPVIKGKFINNGVIRNNPKGNELWLELQGDVVNNGKWINTNTFLPGKKVQYLSQSQGKKFETVILKRDASGWCDTNRIVAASELTFTKRFELEGTLKGGGGYWGTLDMAGNTLNMAGSGYITRGTVINAAIINATEQSVMGDITYKGSVTIRGAATMINGNVTFEGDLTVADTLQNGGGLGWITPSVNGTLVNNGVIRDNPLGNSLHLNVSGSVYNYGKWTCMGIFNTKGADRNLTGIFDGEIRLNKNGTPASGSFQSAGLLKTKNLLYLEGGAGLTVPQGATFQNYGGMYNYGSIKNEGIFSSLHSITRNGLLPVDAAQKAEVNIVDKKNSDTIIFSCYSRSFHPKMASAVQRYWKIESAKTIGGYSLKLYYDDDLLNNNKESNLEAYISNDSGKTWKKISTPVNSSRDTEKNIFTVGNDNYPVTSGAGDIVLSSGDIITGYSVQTAIGGRKQIRVGPPNRYTVSYWNNTNFNTDKFFLRMNTNRGVHIQSVISRRLDNGASVEIPIDSLTYPENKDEVILLVQGLGPKEVRTFDIILTSELNQNLPKVLEPITFTVVALWIGGAVLEEFVSNTIVEGCYEVWRPVRHDKTLTDASVQALSNSMKKAVTVENGLKGIAKKGVEEIVEKTGKAVIWPVSLAKDAFDCLGNTIKGMKDYVNGNFDKSEKELEKVTSWDPNAKEGPAGYGAKGFMATAAPMTYTIYFENKKEAAAPAWKIVIIDTLDQNVFDLASVRFGKMSHTMGTSKLSGNILSWEFVNIELPPNVKPPEGEGWVQFTVMPKSNLPTGTVLKNSAVITFDLNKPLATNAAVNTLDLEAPVTTPLLVKRVSGKDEVELTWSADDKNGAGIKGAQVFMATESGPFTIAAQSDSGKARIKVVPGIKYRFYVLSKDNVGNLEQNPSKILEITTGIEEGEKVPSRFELFQNYPNPFNPMTKIHYTVADFGRVILKIYNMLGQEIRTLVDQELKAGVYEADFNASGFASGVYIYRLSQGEKSEARKMIFLK
ncbi:MAG: T9SS type A sorting domain-containing protein [Bacillota bacterium]